MTADTTQALRERITAYLSGGGLFNPELAIHTAVRDLLIECRDALASHEGHTLTPAQAENAAAWVRNNINDYQTIDGLCLAMSIALCYEQAATQPATGEAAQGVKPYHMGVVEQRALNKALFKSVTVVETPAQPVADREELLGDAIRALIRGDIKCSDDLPPDQRPVHVSARKAFGSVYDLLRTTAPAASGARDAVWLGNDEAIVATVAVQLAQDDGVDDPYHLIWEGGPIPEPWGEVWCRYEPQARRILAAIDAARASADEKAR